MNVKRWSERVWQQHADRIAILKEVHALDGMATNAVQHLGLGTRKVDAGKASHWVAGMITAGALRCQVVLPADACCAAAGAKGDAILRTPVVTEDGAGAGIAFAPESMQSQDVEAGFGDEDHEDEEGHEAKESGESATHCGSSVRLADSLMGD